MSGVGVGLLKLFLGSKFPINDEYLKALSGKEFDEHADLEDDHKMLRKELQEKMDHWAGKFTRKYMGGKHSVRKQMLEKYKLKVKDENLKEDPDETEGHQNTRDTNTTKYYQRMQFEELGNGFHESRMQVDAGDDKNKIEQILLDK